MSRDTSRDPSDELTVQMGKVAHGLWSGKYSSDHADWLGPEGAPAPRGLKALIGRGHREFATGRQQDAAEFYQHLLMRIERADRAGHVGGHVDDGHVATHGFVFNVEERLECLQSGHVRYAPLRRENLVSAPIPIESATNGHVVGDHVNKPRVSLLSCLESYIGANHIDGFLSPSTGSRGPASITLRLATFPDVLMIQAQRFAIGPDGRPIKLDVMVDAPDEIDIGFMRGVGVKQGEVVMKEEVRKGKRKGIEGKR